MRERLSELWISIKMRWSSLSRQIRILLLGGIAVTLVAAMVVVIILNHTEYIVLYNNLTPAQNAEVVTQLQSVGVTPRMEGTALLIPASQENAVRMHLAIMGMPLGSETGFEVYQLGQGLTSTQSERDFFQNAQAEAVLASMIRTIPEVMDVRVTINQRESGAFIFQDERLPASVAIVIERLPGRNLRPEQVQGILNLTLAAVPGLHESNISIMADGEDLTLMLSAAGGDRHAQIMRLTEQLNESYRRRVLGMLTRMFGYDHVDVRVNVMLDTSDLITESITYIPFDPTNPRNNPVDFFESEFERTWLGVPAEGVPGATDNIDVPMYAAEVDDGAGVHVYARNVIDFLVSSEHTLLTHDGFFVSDLSVSVLIDAEELPVGLRDQVTNLVAMASGAPPERIAVQYHQFPRDIAEDEEAVSIFRNPWFWVAVAVLLLLIAALIVYLVIRRRRQQAALAHALDLEEQASLMELMAAGDEEFEPIQLPETQEQKLKNQIRDLAESDPEIVAQLIKTWLMSA